jgi:hypothetical protein
VVQLVGLSIVLIVLLTAKARYCFILFFELRVLSNSLLGSVHGICISFFCADSLDPYLCIDAFLLV